MYSAQDKQYLINQVFNGDLNKVGDDVAEYHRKRKLYDDLNLVIVVNEDWKMTGRGMFVNLGYIPLSYFNSKHDFSISELVGRFTAGEISQTQMFDEAIAQVKLLRNEDIREHCVYSYDRSVYERYYSYLPEFKDRAKARLKLMLTYEPRIEISVKLEILYREAMKNKVLTFDDKMNVIDHRLCCIAHYRSVMLDKGFETAEKAVMVGDNLVRLNNERLEAENNVG